MLVYIASIWYSFVCYKREVCAIFAVRVCFARVQVQGESTALTAEHDVCSVHIKYVANIYGDIVLKVARVH